MSSPTEAQSQVPFRFNYCIDIEILNIVLAKEIYLIPFKKAHAAFDMIRQRMIDTNALCTVPLHCHAPTGTSTPPTALQMLQHYQHLIVNHPSREVPPAEEIFSRAQFRKRSRLLDQVFSRIIGSIYVRGVGRPPRKYAFDVQLDLMLLEHVLQYKAHLRPRSELHPTFSVIRQGIIIKYGFHSDQTIPAPSTVHEGAPTVSQLSVRYQYLITGHVNSSGKEGADQRRGPESARKRSHLLDIIVRDIVTQALSGSEILRKSRRSSLEAPENDVELLAPRPKRRKSYPSVENVIAEPAPRLGVIPTPKALPSRQVVLRDATGTAYTVAGNAKEPRTTSHPEPEDEVVWRRKMEERRMALEEDHQKKNWKFAVLQEQRLKVEQQRVKLQEKTLEMMQKEHKVLVQTLSGLATVFSKVAEQMGIVDPNTSSNDKDQLVAHAVPESCDPVATNIAVATKKPATNDATPMDIELTPKEGSTATDGHPAEEKPAVEDKETEKGESPAKGKTTMGKDSAVKNEPPIQGGASKEGCNEEKQSRDNKESRAGKLVKTGAAKQVKTRKRARAAPVPIVSAGSGLAKSSGMAGASAAVSNGQ